MITDIQHWMNINRLKLNPTKTELVMFGTRSQLDKTLNDCVWLAGVPVYRVPQAKYLGVLLDETLSFKAQIASVCSKALLNIARICVLHPYLSEETCKILVQALVISHLDYANACYIGLPDSEMDKLQRVQTQAAKLVLKAKRLDSATQCLKDLHWLPIQQRIQFKILSLTFQGVHGSTLEYICSMFHPLHRVGARRQGDKTSPGALCKAQNIGGQNSQCCWPTVMEFTVNH